MGLLRWDHLLHRPSDAGALTLDRHDSDLSHTPREQRYTIRNGHQVHVLTACAPLSLRYHRDKVLVFAIDITERKREEARLQANERLMHQLSVDLRRATLDELSAWVIHELSQPLMAMLAEAQASIRLLNLAGHDHNELKRSLEDIAAGGRRASQTLRRLRELLITQDVTHELVDINLLILEVLDLTRSGGQMEGLSVQLTLNANLPFIPGERRRLRQVLANLIVNAIEAMQNVPPEERKLFVETLLGSETTVHLIVRDTGPGIPESIMARIFSALVTTKAGGAGMGLRIARSIVTAHGGEIWVEQEGRGAALHVTLPSFSPSP
jgi:signal transduction histidine kinase